MTEVEFYTNPVTKIDHLTIKYPSLTAIEIEIHDGFLMSTVTPAEGIRSYGLLGNIDGDRTNDLTSRNGLVVPVDSSEERIYYDFGETCKFGFAHHMF